MFVCSLVISPVFTWPPKKHPTSFSFTIIGTAKSHKPVWHSYTTDCPDSKALNIPCLSQFSHAANPLLDFFIIPPQKFVQDLCVEKAFPFVSAIPVDTPNTSCKEF